MPTNAELRAIAIKEGRTRFDPVGPCIHGHTAQRFVCSSSCVACSKVRYTYGPFPRRRTEAERMDRLRVEIEQKEARRLANAGSVYASMRAYSMKRRAVKKGAAVGCRKAYISFVKWVKAESVIQCRWCGVDTQPGHTRHIDHVTPLAKGGADAVENLCVSCPRCNLTKSSKLPEAFMREMQLATTGTPSPSK